MKTIISYLGISVMVLTSCTGKKNEVTEIYSFEELQKKIKIVDTSCENQEKKAHEDIKFGKLYINIEDLYISKSYVDRKKIANALKKYNLLLDTSKLEKNFDENGDPKIFRPDCYYAIMGPEINNVLDYETKKSMIDSIEKEFVIGHPDKIYSERDCDSKFCDLGRDFNNVMNKNRFDISSAFLYPVGYSDENYNEESKTIASFTLYKNGNIKDLSVKAFFSNNTNRKFASYFEKSVAEFVRKAHWIPATSSGLPVNAKVSFEFYHK